MINIAINLTIKPVYLIYIFLYSIFFRYTNNSVISILSIAILVVAFVVLNLLTTDKRMASSNTIIDKIMGVSKDFNIFWLLASLTLFLGLYIPSNLIQLSTLEFYSIHHTPLDLIINTLSLYVGVFFVWVNIIYRLSTRFVKGLIILFSYVFMINGMISYFSYNKSTSIISTLLVYEKKPYFSLVQKIIGLIIILSIFTITYVVLIKKKNLVSSSCILLSVLIFAISSPNVIKILMDMSKSTYVSEDEKKNYDEILPLSKDGNNVVVIMLDRAISGYVPYIFEDKPELVKKYDGFTYYPNSISFGRYTDIAAAALFGGYEYAPVNSNKRNDLTLLEKNNEALKILPYNFGNEGYSVTVCDPPLAGYSSIPDLSIYDDMPYVNAYNTQGAYVADFQKESIEYFDSQQEKAFFWYSVYMCSTPCLKNAVYNDGTYNSLNTSWFFPNSFIECYAVLDGLNELTNIKNDNSNNFIMLQNETTHEPVHLSIDECELLNLAGEVQYENHELDGRVMKIYDMVSYDHYVTNMLSLYALGEWFDYLRENGVYDNTRIIIVSDHGNDLGQFDNMLLDNGVDLERYNCLLMVKDFNSTGYTISNDFMTNADVPTIAMKNVINKPINPYTNNIIKEPEPKEAYVLTSEKLSQGVNDKSLKEFDLFDGELYRVTDNIFDVNNWEKVEP